MCIPVVTNNRTHDTEIKICEIKDPTLSSVQFLQRVIQVIGFRIVGPLDSINLKLSR